MVIRSMLTQLNAFKTVFTTGHNLIVTSQGIISKASRLWIYQSV